MPVSLSVCCQAWGSGARVAAGLGQLRAVADEIVVAADARAAPEDLAAYATVADRLLRYEYHGAGRDLPWLLAQCSGDWVLRVDADELASPMLLAVLPELIASGDALQYWIPTRWLFPDAAHYLHEEPWWPDFHNRLTRNDGTTQFAGLRHSGISPLQPARFIDAPIYHLNLLLTAPAQRASKVGRYEADRPGLKCEDGRPLNETYYHPERSARLAPAAVSHPDRAIIETVLDAAPPRVRRSARPARDAPLVRRAEIDRHWPLRALSDDSYRAKLEPLLPAIGAEAGHQRSAYVRVRNDGDLRWPWGSDSQPAIRLSYHLRREDGALIGEGPRSPLPVGVSPGESTIAPVTVIAPAGAGRYTLEIDLVHEHVRWFGCPTSISFDVRAPAPGESERSGPARSRSPARLEQARRWVSGPVVRASSGPVAGLLGLPSPPHYREHGDRGAPLVALTFDDGPGPSTPLILDILREAQAQATFFILGRHVAGFEAVLRRSAAEGHELGNHGFSHRSLRGHPWRALRELRATNRLIRAVTGTVPRLFRAPHGYVSPSVVAAAALAGLTTVQWDLDTRDYTDRAAGGIRLAVREKACGGSVILMHDAALNRGGVRGDRADLERRAATVAALPGVIDDLRARGYHLRPASAVLGAG